MTDTQITYVVGAGCGFIGLIAFLTLVVIPAATAYQRVWQRAAVVVLSLYVLAALVGLGILAGLVIVLEWPRLF